MSFYGIEVRDGRFQVYETEDGIRRIPIPTGSFGNPRDAIRYADMRQQHVSPLRSSAEVSAPSPRLPLSPREGDSSGSPR